MVIYSLPAIISTIMNAVKSLDIEDQIDKNKVKSVLAGRFNDEEIRKFIEYRKRTMKSTEMHRDRQRSEEVENFVELDNGQSKLYDSTVGLISKLRRSERRLLARLLQNV